jgi:hypothetical protein
MTRCDHCSTLVLFGGVSRAGLRFCSDTCAESAHRAVVGQSLPEREVRQRVWELYKGTCPCCGGEGPTDIRTSYRVFSLVLLTRWSSHPKLACRGCGARSQLLAIALSVLFGWWGLPWGLVLTPIQILRNVIAIAIGGSDVPSDALEQIVRVELAQRLLATRQPPLEVTSKAS